MAALRCEFCRGSIKDARLQFHHGISHTHYDINLEALSGPLLSLALCADARTYMLEAQRAMVMMRIITTPHDGLRLGSDLQRVEQRHAVLEA